MSDIPEDLTDVGTHHGNQPPPDTGQTVRSPEGPDPNAGTAQPSPALFQVIRGPSEDRLTVRTHSARAEMSPPDEGEELDQYRTVDGLQSALSEADIEGWSAVFEDTEADRVLVETDVTAEHAWIGQPRYSTIHFFANAEDAATVAEEHERPAPDR